MGRRPTLVAGWKASVHDRTHHQQCVGVQRDHKTGKPTFIANYPVQEQQPRNIAFSPNGHWLVVTGEKSSVVGSYAIGKQGALKRVSGTPSGKGALWIETWQTKK